MIEENLTSSSKSFGLIASFDFLKNLGNTFVYYWISILFFYRLKDSEDLTRNLYSYIFHKIFIYLNLFDIKNFSINRAIFWEILKILLHLLPLSSSAKYFRIPVNFFDTATHKILEVKTRGTVIRAWKLSRFSVQAYRRGKREIYTKLRDKSKSEELTQLTRMWSIHSLKY